MLPKNIHPEFDIENEYSIDELDQIINSLALYDTQIRMEEIFNLETSNYINKFIEKIKNDNRFIVICEKNANDIFILPLNSFVAFLCKLNIKLGSLEIGSINITQLEHAFINSIIKTNNKNILAKLIKTAEKLSLLEIEGEYILFPLADVFNAFFRILNKDFHDLLKKIIQNREQIERVRKSDIVRIISTNDQGDEESTHNKRNLDILLHRLGLKRSKKITLEKIGSRYKLTRERVRQIIDMELNRLRKNYSIKKALIEVILRHLITNKRKKIYYLNKEKDNMLINILKYFINIYVYVIDRLDLFYIFFNNSKKGLKNIFIKLENIEKGLFGNKDKLDPKNSLFLSKMDKQIIKGQMLKKISKYKIEKELIIKAMENIGRPAHYVDIASECNKICSDIKITPRDVIIILTRKGGEREEWTWAGRRGYYALKKWGYKRPKENLFSTVSKIVNKYYQEFKRPVHINFIKGEIQKTGRLYSEKSLYFACYENPEIEQIRKNWFIPRKNEREKIKHEENYIDLEYLDKAIRDLEKFRDHG